MFEEELAMVEESFRGMGRAREGVDERGGRADERTLTRVLTATERLRRAADALELTVIGQTMRWGEERGPDGLYRPVHLAEGESAEFAAEAVALAVRAGPWEAGARCELAGRAVTDLRPLADRVADGLLRIRAVEIVAKESREVVAKRLREDDPEMSADASRAHGLVDLALRGVELTTSIRIGIPVITSAASRLAFVPYEGGEGSGSTLGQELHGPTAREGRFVTGEGADAVDVIPEEWAGDAVTSQVPTTIGPGGRPSWISGCDIPGVGFIPADVVAALTTHLETKVSRALIDARTGVLVETSNPRYVLSDAMREFVAARDETCRMWGCNRRVRAGCAGTNADLDHATPWPTGPSCPANLSGLCRHHHRLKHTPGWTHTLHEDGRTEWVSPGGLPASTFPATWVHTEDEGDAASPPVEGAKEIVAALAEAPPF